MADATLSRLDAAADEVERAHEAWVAAIERRDRIAMDALDEGYTQGQVARAGRMSPTNVWRIIARGRHAS